MQPFQHLDAVAIPIARPNVDTDQILPARYLQKPRANDFGQFLFRDVRFRKDASGDLHAALCNFALIRGLYRPIR